MVLSDIFLGVASIIALLGVLAATVAFSNHIANVCADKLAEAEKLRFKSRRRPASTRQDRELAK